MVLRHAPCERRNGDVFTRSGNVRKDYAPEFREIFAAARLSQAEFARRSGYRPERICRWLRGRLPITGRVWRSGRMRRARLVLTAAASGSAA